MRKLSIFDEFDDFFNVWAAPQKKQACCSKTQGVQISEDENHFFVDAPLPGVKVEDVNVSIDREHRHLTICGKASAERDEATIHTRKQESFCYSIPLGDEVDTSSELEADYKNGIISLTLPKNSSRQKPLKIPIRSG